MELFAFKLLQRLGFLTKPGGYWQRQGELRKMYWNWRDQYEPAIQFLKDSGLVIEKEPTRRYAKNAQPALQITKAGVERLALEVTAFEAAKLESRIEEAKAAHQKALATRVPRKIAIAESRLNRWEAERDGHPKATEEPSNVTDISERLAVKPEPIAPPEELIRPPGIPDVSKILSKEESWLRMVMLSRKVRAQDVISARRLADVIQESPLSFELLHLTVGLRELANRLESAGTRIQGEAPAPE